MDGHKVVIRCGRVGITGPITCTVEVDGLPIHGVHGVSFAIDKRRQPMVSITFRPSELDIEADHVADADFAKVAVYPEEAK